MKKTALLLLSALVFWACSTPSSVDTYIAFLYDNMSLPDSVDYPRDYYLQLVRRSLATREAVPWGSTVPEREFRHFVLPPRVNNEDLDDFRTRYSEELIQRVQGLDMQQAILEVNHWCHEHVTYRPTSARTLGPVATIRTAYGRCGEESVLLVAALRAVGIPARQVYTPRWAHTDDNHAWVEAWADGRWWFLGACEPEPVLNLGWFNESASRGMLMHTKVFGQYCGPEEVVNQQNNLTEINVIENYAPARRLTVCVVDSTDRPVAGADVEFKLYNYAEFYTVARKQTDSEGKASLTAGLGDMLIWVSTPTSLAFQEVHFALDSLVTLRLGGAEQLQRLRSYPMDVVPPAASPSQPEVSAEQRAENSRRLAIEDSIRHAYEATMSDQRSRGNQAIITAFRDSAAAIGRSEEAERLLRVLPDKDLQDITCEVLLDNLLHTQQSSHDEFRDRYLLSPRIERERLTAFKQPLHAAFHDLRVEDLITWVRDSVQLVEGRNPQRLRMQPLGVYRSRLADALGRDIFFVAACRSIGIPARINEINGKVQYWEASAEAATSSDAQWHDVLFDQTPDSIASPTAAAEEGRLLLSYTPTPHLPDCKYYIHFTLSRLDAQNRWQLLTYPEEATFDNTFRQGVTLDVGTYLLTTGIRLADGSVRALLTTFEIRKDATTSIPLVLRTATDAVAVIGSLNAENLYLPLTIPAAAGAHLQLHEPTSLLATCGRGYYCLGLIAPNQEPTNHALRDIALLHEEFEQWGRRMVLLFEDKESAERFNFQEISEKGTAPVRLPSTTVWGTDTQGTIRQEVIEQLHLTSDQQPIFLICDSFNRVVFVSQGYTIGLGEQLLKVIQQL